MRCTGRCTGNATEVDLETLLTQGCSTYFSGDFDRHRKQWRWANLPSESRWQPIPEDRDQAFVRFTGLAPALARMSVPTLQRYTKGYQEIKDILEIGVVAQDRQRRRLQRLRRLPRHRVPPEYQCASSGGGVHRRQQQRGRHVGRRGGNSEVLAAHTALGFGELRCTAQETCREAVHDGS